MTAFPDWTLPDGTRRTYDELVMHERLLGWDIRPGDNAIVIGGYDGATCEFILDRFPEVQLYTFEPQVDFYHGLLRKFHGCSNVQVLPYGLGNRSGTFPMTRSGSYFASFLTGEYAQLGYGEEDSVGELCEFSTVMDTLKIEELAWFHSNCEGYEYILFPHMLKLGWTERIGQIVIAWHDYSQIHPDAKPYEEIVAGIERTHQRMWQEPPLQTAATSGWWAWSRPDRTVLDVPAALRAAGVTE